jgi:hypothetical protein
MSEESENEEAGEGSDREEQSKSSAGPSAEVTAFRQKCDAISEPLVAAGKAASDSALTAAAAIENARQVGTVLKIALGFVPGLGGVVQQVVNGLLGVGELAEEKALEMAKAGMGLELTGTAIGFAGLDAYASNKIKEEHLAIVKRNTERAAEFGQKMLSIAAS